VRKDASETIVYSNTKFDKRPAVIGKRHAVHFVLNVRKEKLCLTPKLQISKRTGIRIRKRPENPEVRIGTRRTGVKLTRISPALRSVVDPVASNRMVRRVAGDKIALLNPFILTEA
jgi:hypothetical protein